jgi:hypothetical protein
MPGKRALLQKANVNLIELWINASRQILDNSADCSAARLSCIQDVKDAPWIHSLCPLIRSDFIASWPSCWRESARNLIANIARGIKPAS